MVIDTPEGKRSTVLHSVMRIRKRSLLSIKNGGVNWICDSFSPQRRRISVSDPPRDQWWTNGASAPVPEDDATEMHLDKEVIGRRLSLPPLGDL